jgi:hypothetical protein
MRRPAQAVLPAALAVLLTVFSISVISCSGGGGGGDSSPTAPPTTTLNTLLGVTFSVGRSTAPATVSEMIVKLDGQQIGRSAWNPACSTGILGCTVNVVVRGVAPGRHTLDLVVVRQSRSTITYGEVIFVSQYQNQSTGSLQTIGPLTQRASITQGVPYSKVVDLR